jgi:hypothetical protein
VIDAWTTVKYAMMLKLAPLAWIHTFTILTKSANFAQIFLMDVYYAILRPVASV